VIPLLVAIGTIVICTIGTLQALYVWKKTDSKLHLLHIPVNLLGIASFGFLYYSLQNSFSVSVGAAFYLFLSFVFPPLFLWSEEFTKRMEKISSTAEFEIGLPLPSDSYQLLGALGQLVQELARPIVAVQGVRKVNQKISDISKEEPLFSYIEARNDGSLYVDPRVIPVFQITDSVKDAFVDLTDFLVKESLSIAGRISRKEAENILKSRVSHVMDGYRNIFIEHGLLDRLGEGLFTSKISSGVSEFDLMTGGGYPKQTAMLVCGPPSDERNLILDSFIGTGLSRGHSCMYVTSAHPPGTVMQRFGDLSSEITMVDCYTNRVQEVDTITREGNVITSPIEMSVVGVAISRAMDKDEGKVKRAVVDILPTYLVFQSVEKIYLDLMEIIDDLRKNGYTVLFSLNPYYIKDEGAISTLEELFDGIIHVERTADESGVRNEIKLRVDKMAGQQLSRSTFSIQLPGTRGWTAERQTPAETGPYPDTTPVEA
jgi:KaiC/GvpD/RAD55 family RecA-like ATPase